jgi:hypothetical protein
MSGRSSRAAALAAVCAVAFATLCGSVQAGGLRHEQQQQQQQREIPVPQRQLQNDGCQSDENMLSLVVQRGCRVLAGSSPRKLCCGQCGRSVCKTERCVGCEDQWVAKQWDGDAGSLIQPSMPAWATDNVDKLSQLQALAQTGLTAAAGVAFGPAKGALKLLLHLLSPQNVPIVWSQIAQVIDIKIQKAFADQVTGQFFGASGSVVDYLNLYSLAENMTVADGFAVRGKNAQLAQNTARAAWNTFTNTVVSQDMKMKTIKLAMAAASITLFTDKLMYTTYADAVANPWQGLDLNGTASLRDDAQVKLEEDLREIMNLTSALAADYVPWYVKQSGAGCGAYGCVYNDGGLQFNPSVGATMLNIDEGDRFMKSQAYSRALRDLAPLFVLPKFVDKALPAWSPLKASAIRVVNGPYHPYLFDDQFGNTCCNNPNPLVRFPSGRMSQGITADLNADIDGISIMGLGSGNCRSKPDSCSPVANPTGEYMLSAYLYTVSGGKFQAGLELHTESGEMLADGRDVSGKTKTDRWIIQSPLAGLDADNFVISAVRSETTTAKMFDFQYDWAGKCFPDWSDVKELTNPLAQETKDAIAAFYGDFGPSPGVSDDVAWFRAACHH